MAFTVWFLCFHRHCLFSSSQIHTQCFYLANKSSFLNGMILHQEMDPNALHETRICCLQNDSHQGLYVSCCGSNGHTHRISQQHMVLPQWTYKCLKYHFVAGTKRSSHPHWIILWDFCFVLFLLWVYSYYGN